MRPHGTDGGAHALRRLVVGLTLDADQDDGRALVGGETAQCSAEIAQQEAQLARMRCRRRIGHGNLLQCRGRAGGSVRPREKAVAHDRVEPAAQIRPRLPQMAVGESLQERVLDEIVGIGFFAMPAPRRTAEERYLLLDLPRELRLRELWGCRREGTWLQRS